MTTARPKLLTSAKTSYCHRINVSGFVERSRLKERLRKSNYKICENSNLSTEAAPCLPERSMQPLPDVATSRYTIGRNSGLAVLGERHRYRAKRRRRHRKEPKKHLFFELISHLLPSERTPDTITVDSIGKVVSNFNIYNMIMWKECFPASDQHILVRDRM